MSNLITEIYDKQAVVDNLNQLGELINSSLNAIVASAPKLQSPIEYLTAVQSISEIEKKNTEVTQAKAKALSDLDKAYQQADKAIQQSINLDDAEFQAQTKLTSQYKERAKEQKQLLELERTRQQTMQNGAKLLQMEAKSEGELRMQQQQLIKAQQSLRVTNAEENALREKLIAKINANKEALRGMSDEVSKQRDNIGNYKSALDGVVTGQIDLREAMVLTRKELQQLETLQATGTALTAEQRQRYNDLNLAMGQMKDIQGDIAQRTKILADDYRGMTAAMESVKLGVNIVTSLKAVTALLGDENVELAKTMAQIVAIQQTLNTITLLQNQLNKDGIIQTNLRMLAERDLTNATIAQTAATKASIVAMKALQALQTAGKGIVGVFGAALFGMVKMIKDVVTNTNKAEEAQKAQTESLKEATQATAIQIEKLQEYKQVLDDIAESYNVAIKRADLFTESSAKQVAMGYFMRQFNEELERYTELAWNYAQRVNIGGNVQEATKAMNDQRDVVQRLAENIRLLNAGIGSSSTSDSFIWAMGQVENAIKNTNAIAKENNKTKKESTENNKEETKSITEVVEAKEEEIELDENWFRSAVSNLQRVNEKRKESQQIWTDMHEENKSVIKDAEDALNRACEEAIEALKSVDEQQRKSAEETKKLWEERKNATFAALNNMNDAAKTIGQQENDRLDKQMQDFEDYYARRKNIIENTVLDEEVKNRRLQNLENEKVAKERQIAKQRAEIQRKQAIFQNAVDAAAAMSKAVASVGELLATSAGGDAYSAVARYIAAIAAGVSAVTTISTLISKLLNIPAYEKGGLAEANKPFIAGEKGREIGFGVHSGKVYDFSKPTLFKANEPINIKNATETRQIINNNTTEYNKDVTLHSEISVQVIDNTRINKFFKIW